MSIFLTIIFIITALILIISIAIQNDQGEMSSMFGGGGTQQFATMQGGVSFIAIVAVIFFLTAISLARLHRSPEVIDLSNAVQENLREINNSNWWETQTSDRDEINTTKSTKLWWNDDETIDEPIIQETVTINEQTDDTIESDTK